MSDPVFVDDRDDASHFSPNSFAVTSLVCHEGYLSTMNNSWQSFPSPSAACENQRHCVLEHWSKGDDHVELVLWCQLKMTFLRRRFFYTHEICVRQRVFHIECMSSMLVVCKVLLFTIPSRQETPKMERRHLR